MRFIVKPAGMALIIVSLSSLAGFSLSRQNSRVAALSPETAPQTATATITPLQTALSGGDAARPLSTHEQEMLPAPALVSEKWNLLSQEGESDSHTYSCSLPHFNQLRRVRLTTLPKQPWNVQLRQTATGALTTGAHVRIRVWGRSKNNCPITVVCEHNAAPYEKLATRTFTLTPEWQQYDMDWTADRDTPNQWAQVSLQLGGKVGEIDLAGASLIASTLASKKP